MLSVTILATMALSAVSSQSAGECRVLLVPKRAAEEVVLADTALGPCQALLHGRLAQTRLVYDARRRILRAREALAVGQDLGRVYFPPRPEVRAGDHFALAAHVGHVVISRDVVAMQDADRGQRFFVRDPDGQIFVIPAIRVEQKP